LLNIRLKLIAQITNTVEPSNTGDKIKLRFALEITPSKATAPAGG
tara:strand:- start:159 stop:293 length:135 start_codon:yes stop_codon:yes gene_type:complete